MDRVALDLGFVQVYWYSIFILLAVFVGGYLAYREVKRQNISVDFFFNMLFWCVIISIIGARLYYVLFNLDYYLEYPLEIIEVWNGGLAIHGAIFAGLLFIFLYTKKYKVRTLKMLDIAAVSMLISQAIGRWGNFFNGEAHGPETTVEFLKKLHLPKFIIEGMNIDGVYYQPTFLYESLWNIIGFVIILILRRNRYRKTGQLTGFYLMWYSLGRFFIEMLRTDSLMLGNIKIAVLVSAILFVIGLLMFIFLNKGSRFDRLYNEVEVNDIKF